MTAKEMMTDIGKTATFSPLMGIFFDVTIADVRKVFNRVDYLVDPVSGSGNSWVSADRVRIKEA
jgi:hypothetical protein